MRYIFTIVTVLVCISGALARSYSVDQIPNVHVADRHRYVSNPDGILSAAAVDRLDAAIDSIWQGTTAEVAVVVVESIDGGDIDDFATRLYTKWGIGKSDNDNGLLFLVSRDDRRMAIRTGYGMEGVVPDVIAGRIIRNLVAPRFREGDYDGGVTAAVGEIGRLITTPGATEELLSKQANNANARGNEADTFFSTWITIGVGLTVLLVVWIIYTLIATARYDRYERYQRLRKMLMPALIMGFLGIGIPFVGVLVLWLAMRYQRVRSRRCPNCHARMRRLDEKSDNAYLTPAQDLEEKLDSVDYDVWLCDQCGETDILPFVNQSSHYQYCPHCGARACTLRSDRIVAHPTEYREGQGVKEYVCHNCGKPTYVKYNIPKAVVPPVVILPGGGGFGHGGGGGFSGGSFGGGSTGGGGASGGW